MHTKLLAGVIGLTLLTAACGDDSSDATDAAPESMSETTVPGTTGTSAEPSQEPEQRIVSLAPTLTEMVFAIGAGDQLVAVDEYSDYPSEALELPHELSGFEPNVEAIAGYEPDVVLISGDFTGLGDQLAPLGIEVWDGPAAVTLDDTYAQIEGLGELTGHQAEAAALVAQMQADIDEIVAGLPAPPVESLTYYHELDSNLFSVTSNTFIGTIYALLGLENVADAAATDTDYPQLNAEFLIDANPDLIFLADTKCCGESLATVSERAGWDVITAVQTGDVIEMDDDIASRWGPRIVDYLEAAAEAVANVAVVAG